MSQTAGKTVALRVCTLAVAAAGLLFWLYTFYGLAQVPAGDGTGMQWVAVVPLGFVFFLFGFPALLLSLKGRSLWLALILGVVGLTGLILLWRQLLWEFST